MNLYNVQWCTHSQSTCDRAWVIRDRLGRAECQTLALLYLVSSVCGKICASTFGLQAHLCANTSTDASVNISYTHNNVIRGLGGVQVCHNVTDWYWNVSFCYLVFTPRYHNFSMHVWHLDLSQCHSSLSPCYCVTDVAMSQCYVTFRCVCDIQMCSSVIVWQTDVLQCYCVSFTCALLLLCDMQICPNAIVTLNVSQC